MSGLITSSFLKIQNQCPIIAQKRNFIKKLLSIFGQNEGDKDCGPKLNECSRIETRGMSMPIVGLGTWQIPPECIDAVVTCALNVGYRHIDTAHSYGNQAAIGETLDCLFRSCRYSRNEIFISSKLPYYGMTPEKVCDYVQDSLNCLRLSYLDLFMIHFPVGIKQTCGSEYEVDAEVNHCKIWKALEEEVRKDRIKAIGLSNFNIQQITALMECAEIPPANLQIEMHLYLQQKQLRDFCSKNCIGVTAYAPLGSPGLEEYLQKNCLEPSKVPPPLSDHDLQMIGCKYKKTPAQILLRYLLQNGVAVIPKSSRPERVYKNFDLFNFSLDCCEMDELASKDKAEKGRMFGSNVWVGTEEHPQYPFPRN